MSAAFHRGEVAAQSRFGKADRMQHIGAIVIRDAMPEQHREFFAQLPYVFYGAVDGDGQPWASLFTGAPGFVHSPDPRELRIDAAPVAGDPVFPAIARGSDIGLLGIDFETRRRNRLNGRVTKAAESGLTIEVAQSFGNCPKYIQSRVPEAKSVTRMEPRISRSSTLQPKQIELLQRSDTFFIASAFSEGRGAANEGVDVSHRGGLPGFVSVEDERTLSWPEYLGNYHFNTIGNLLLNPRSGLLFLDFETGSLLFLAGTAQVTWDGPAVDRVPGAERLLRFSVDQVIESRSAVPLRWSFNEYSRFLPGAQEGLAVQRRASQ